MPPVQYLDFELEIGAGGDGKYPIAVLHAPGGDARAVMQFPFAAADLDRQLATLERAILAPSQPGLQEGVRQFGAALFDALFPPEIRALYDVSKHLADEQSQGLRVKLRIVPAELAVIPWEFLYDTRLAEFVALSRRTPIVRYVELAHAVRRLAVTPPLRILGLVSSPADLPKVDVAREQNRIDQAIAPLQASGQMELVWLEKATASALQQTLQSGPWHIFHYIGHAAFDAQLGEGVLVLEDDDGMGKPLTATQLARLLADEGNLRLVLLNACEGARGDEQSVFSSTAGHLVRRELPAVLAMQYPVSDRAAIEFSRGFYSALAANLALDAATAEGRKAISLALNDTPEWGAPVLYMRAPDGAIWDVQSGAGEPENVAAGNARAQTSVQPAAGNVLSNVSIGGDVGDIISAGPTIQGNVTGSNIITIGKLNVPRWLLWTVAALLIGILAVVAWFGFADSRRGETLEATAQQIQAQAGQIEQESGQILEAVNATPTPTPIPKMTGAIFNIAVAQFAHQNDGATPTNSEAGDKLGRLVFNALNGAYEQNPQLAFGASGNVQIWYLASDALQTIVDGGLVVDEAGAAHLASAIGANMVLFGRLSDEEAPGRLALEFYYNYPYLASQPDAVAGRHQLGAALPFDTHAQPEVAIFSINEPLALRSDILFRITVGLTYDVNGDTLRALDVFQEAAYFLEASTADRADVDPLKEVVYYFLGRQALQVRQYDRAIDAFNKALALNDAYSIAYVGRGGIPFDQAQLFYIDPANLQDGLEQCVQEEDLTEAGLRVENAQQALAKIDEALADYVRAVDAAEDSPLPSSKAIAQLALALGYRLQGQAYDHAGEFERARTSLELASGVLADALPSLEAMGQLQLLGLAYLSRGTVQHTLGSVYARTQAEDASVAAFEAALNDYRKCIDLGEESDADPFLRQQIIECGCKPYEQQVEQSLIQLGGGTG